MDDDQKRAEVAKIEALNKIADQMGRLANAVQRVETQLRNIAAKR